MLNSLFITGCFMAIFGTLAYGQSQMDNRHSFTPTYDDDVVHHWRHSPAIRIEPERLRLTPYPNIKSGYLWNTVRSVMVSWEVTFQLKFSKLSRANDNTEGEGFAFWYSEDPNVMGHVFGSTDYWKGLGLFFEQFSLNNTDQSEVKYLKISANLNDGSHRYGKASAGDSTSPESNGQRRGSSDPALLHTQDSSDQKDGNGVPVVGACYRTMPRYPEPSPTTVRVRYSDKVLSVSFVDKTQVQECFSSQSPVELGVDKFFGLTASAADPVNQYDVFYFKSINLRPDANQQMLENIRRSSANHKHIDDGQFRIDVVSMVHQIQDQQRHLEEFQEHTFGLLRHKLAVGYNNSMALDDIGRLINSVGAVVGQSYKKARQNRDRKGYSVTDEINRLESELSLATSRFEKITRIFPNVASSAPSGYIYTILYILCWLISLPAAVITAGALGSTCRRSTNTGQTANGLWKKESSPTYRISPSCFYRYLTKSGLAKQQTRQHMPL